MKTENVFYGMRNVLSLFNSVDRTINSTMLDQAYNECKTPEQKKLFFIVCFQLGELSRDHLFLKKPTPRSGHGKNEHWMVFLNWLFNKDKKQFIAFLPLMVEMVGLRELVSIEIRTKHFRKTILSEWGLLKLIQKDEDVYNALLDHLVKMVDSNNPFYRSLVAKHVHIPRFSKRIQKDKNNVVKGKRELQSSTVSKMKAYERLVTDLSDRKGWEIIKKDKYTDFAGYKEWRTPYMGEFEFVLFSNGKIKDFDQEQFKL